MRKEFNDMEKYQKLIGKKVKDIIFSPYADEGLCLFFEDNSVLAFGFSGCEGTIDCIIRGE